MFANIYVCTYHVMRGGGDQAEIDLDNVFYTGERNGGKKKVSRRQKRRKTATRRKNGGSDPSEADFDSIFGKNLRLTGGRKWKSRRTGKSKAHKRIGRKRGSLFLKKKGGHSWSNIGVDRVRRSLQSGKIVETGRLRDYNVYNGAF